MSIVLRTATGPQSLDFPIEFVLQKMLIPKLSQRPQKLTFCIKNGQSGSVVFVFLLSLMSRSETSPLNHQKYFRSSVNFGYANNYDENGPCNC